MDVCQRLTAKALSIYITNAAQIHFQVKALRGYIDKTHDPDAGLYERRFNGEENEWSETHTITLGETQTPTQQTEVRISAAIAATSKSASLAVLILFKKRKQP